ARIGILETKKGSIITPVFMPVATLGTVKTLSTDQLKNIGVTTLMCNTYHLLIRPGLEVIKKAGGLHAFINWNMPVFTDSGGFQIFSLSNFVKVDKDFIEYVDHLTGAKFILTPQQVVSFQEDILQSDMLVPLDYPSFYRASYQQASYHLDITMSWAEAGLKVYKGKGLLFGINQGGIYEDLRLKSLEFLLSKNFDGIAIGGLGLGEPPEKTIEIAKLIREKTPPDKPIYVMGLGRPQDVVKLIEHGVDMFDCVLPTRNGRFGRAYTFRGIVILKNNKYIDDLTPIDDNCKCFACIHYSKALLRHLIIAQEILGVTMVTLHNVHFYIELFEKIKEAIIKDRFLEWKEEFLRNYSNL
ncbi:MAG: tRNA guanosine(34) transglycosylase Tgt, partial [Planctomycetota bacterium]